MKRNALFVTVAAMLLSSCVFRINTTSTGPKPAASAEAAVSMADSAAAKGFTRIESNGSFDVYYTQGDTLSIRLEGDTASTRHTIVTGDGKTLTISAANDGDLTTKLKYQMKVYVTSPALTEVSIKGSGNFIAERGISAEKLSMHIAGSGDIKVKGVKADDFSIDIAGSGDIAINGSVKECEKSVAGSGSVKVTK